METHILLAVSVAVWSGGVVAVREPGPYPIYLQFTDVCLPASQPQGPFQVPGRFFSAGRGREVTFPGTVTGPEDSLPFGTEDLCDLRPSWGRHEPFRVIAGAQRGSLKVTADGHHADQAVGIRQPWPVDALGPQPILLALEWSRVPAPRLRFALCGKE